MRALTRLFGRSPFAPLQTHMAKVKRCIEKIAPLFKALKKKDYTLVESIAHEISKLEHEADLSKNDIRNNLPTGLFLPVGRASLLEILTLQDSLADRAEDIAVLLTLRNLEIDPIFGEEFQAFSEKNLDAFQSVSQIIRELDELIESSFGGLEAEKVRKMVEEVAFKEHEADQLQRKLLTKMFSSRCDTMAPPVYFLWMRIIYEMAAISDVSEKLANRVRMTLEVK
ncbi:MAG: hypothetical protein KR126chlam2_01187 [Chlamydiae bacterium]|nr:hypothetical protein [Chlamydiota bacterium]